MSIIEQILRIFAPHICLGCGGEGRLLCSRCVSALPAVLPRCYKCAAATDSFRTCIACRHCSPLFAVVPVTEYEGVAKELIQRLKFERARAAAEDIAEAIAAQDLFSGLVAVTYVPTAPSRVRTRGYDQAQLIAAGVARRLGLPCLTLVARVSSKRQLGQNRATRQQQMQHAFRARSGSVDGGHILLIDDVFTTGATCEAVGATLLAAGATRVTAAVFAAA